MAVSVRSQVSHPLDPLGPEEIAAAGKIVREQRGLTDSARIVSITLHEPSKDVVQSFKPGDPIDREAFIVVLDKAERATYEAVVSITAGEVRSWKHVPDVQPPIIFDEFLACESVVKQHPDFQEAMRKRGITDLDLVMVEPWSAGYYGDESERGQRLLRALVWVRPDPEGNGYAHPVDNVVVVFDLNANQVVRVEDYGVIPVPKTPGEYRPEAIGPLRTDLKPLEIHQAQGPSFVIDGHEVRWQRWRFRVGFTAREGLVLHTVGYEDKGRVRPILYRASLSEMVVPYGDPSPTQWRKNAFDAGEYNIGALANSLELGCDCLGEIRYFDAVLSDTDGNPVVIKNAICLHEEDYGILWKHYDFRLETAEVRRSRRLVISWIATVGNYEYGFFWYFYQDGTIQHEVKLTGLVSTAALPPGQKSPYGQLLSPDGLYGPIHQHFFNYRLDFDVDGPVNAVYEVHSAPEPLGPDNPHGNAFRSHAVLLEREGDGHRVVDPLSARYWKIVNHNSLNKVGEPVAYRLMPHGNVLPMAHPTASVMQRAGFMTKHVWVTPYRPEEKYAAGDYPNQHPGGAGLPAWTAQNRPIVDTDVVVWYTLGSHHVVRLEDWPVMPVQYVGFLLQPFGFFDANPALDVPPQHLVNPNGHGSHCGT
ncbi:primary-amine oxidase [Sphaerobacter thermophilus]|uniref:Amine oxidase n=1 Tax=Sphaerobacter thermophilus (strain ATCC 49802 / DSM 20745 / KCCM 41009 / NCIMB 13125 / S 6022) TaxID=479434 RepID=D1C992_SPHTD|nr:primary-amine oxidase [Sphaerobacter thermophilus]ACZ40385.1 Primary-amine oxidase [Sphaerobacter thermophilus DSM 20745]